MLNARYSMLWMLRAHCPVYIPDVYPIMTRTKLFRSNRTQAVRLPKEVAFGEKVSR
jgi:hypothetical protein